MSANKWQFSTRDLLLVTLVIAGMCGLLAAVQPPIAFWIVSSAVVSLFLVLDRLFFPRVATGSPLRISVARFIALHATGYSVAALACLMAGLFIIGSQSPVGLAALFRGLGRAVFVILYLLAASMFSATAFVASVVALRRFAPAKWLALVNLPGALIFCSLAGQIIVHNIAKDP